MDLNNYVTVDDGRPVTEWADCPIPGCPNKRCARLGSQFCYPHSNDPTSKIVKGLELPILEEEVVG